MRLPDGPGLRVVEHINQKALDLPVAVITAYASAENAVAALKAGAFDYLAKPVALEQLRALVKQALKVPEKAPPPSGYSLLGESPAMLNVRNMVAALRSFLSVHPYPDVVLIGYSGGGTLAWLMASRIPETTRVITIAANLDIAEWTRIHGYTPLSGSLDPALAPELEPAIDQLHYVGGRDTNVSPSIVRAFARRHPEAHVIEIPEFDHRCCWIERWPELVSSRHVAESMQ